MKKTYGTIGLLAGGLLTGALLAAPLLAGDREEAAVALYAIERSGITATQALEMASKAVGGVAYEYELDDDDGALFHEIELMDLEQQIKYKVKIAVADGAISQKQEKAECGLVCKDDDVKAARALQEAGYSLGQALERSPGDRELLEEMEVELKSGVRYIKLEFVGPEGERDLLIDIDSGQPIPSLTTR